MVAGHAWEGSRVEWAGGRIMNIISGSLPSLPSYDDEDEDVREEYLEHAKPICPRPSSSESRRRLFVRSSVPIGGNAERTDADGRTDGRTSSKERSAFSQQRRRNEFAKKRNGGRRRENPPRQRRGSAVRCVPRPDSRPRMLARKERTSPKGGWRTATE